LAETRVSRRAEYERSQLQIEGNLHEVVDFGSVARRSPMRTAAIAYVDEADPFRCSHSAGYSGRGGSARICRLADSLRELLRWPATGQKLFASVTAILPDPATERRQSVSRFGSCWVGDRRQSQAFAIDGCDVAQVTKSSNRKGRYSNIGVTFVVL
jgi:hypothetical protein